ncbi:glycosyltransferase family 4 protein [Treponema sp.]|uniref:glycosyltransferase family 4 protein n=1 Tax=Treponema sp. TaxID=166 RepID=UPI00298D96D2|nr:glycosyltransferase family 4 protein [Treponema sp.]MCR5612477.1 glycosyltransferase family 4 protein [Treponema sp.]
MKKILFISNTANFSKFNRPFMRWFKQQGWQVDYCSAGEESVLDCDNQYSICMARSPFSLKNFTAYKQFKKIVYQNQYDVIHCHTPMGGLFARLAARKLWKSGNVKIIYTAHGFHFYKGAPLLNWMLYYPVEKWLSKYCDAVVTINHEDYNRASKSFYCPVEYIDGVGVDLSRFCKCTDKKKSLLRKELGFSDSQFIVTVVAELNKNKNQLLLINKIPDLLKSIPELKVLFIGKETLPLAREQIAHLGISDSAVLMGYRTDVDKFTSMSDVAFSASLREGLPVNIIEAMACGIPVLCSHNRGHDSLIKDGENGFLFDPDNADQMAELLIKMHDDKELRKRMGQTGVEYSKKYSLDLALSRMAQIYKQYT